MLGKYPVRVGKDISGWDRDRFVCLVLAPALADGCNAMQSNVSANGIGVVVRSSCTEMLCGETLRGSCAGKLCGVVMRSYCTEWLCGLGARNILLNSCMELCEVAVWSCNA